MRLLTRRLVASLTSLSLACARMEPPPGGPPDAVPPQLVQTVPDSFQVFQEFDSDVEFVFDEVVSEGGSPNQGTGTGDLERLVILSPTSEVPKVRWRRNRITVRPDEGWQQDRVYRVELLPGVTDLRRNRLDSGTVVTFSTGAPAPRTRFEGVVVDWTNARPAQGALVVAMKVPDSLAYRGLADSSGHFSLGPLPAGQYVVSGVLDENRNHLADPREAFDSLRLARSDSTLELWAFVHDTSAARVRTVTPQDSVSASVELTQPLDPKLRLQPSAVRLSLLPDSTAVRVASILPKPLDDSLHARRPSETDTTARDTTARDTTAPPGQVRARARPGARRREAEQLTSRPALTSVLVLRPAAPWRPGARYTVEIRGVRNVTGVTGDVVGTLVIPEPAPRDTTRAGRDSVPAKPAPAKPAPGKPAPAKPVPAKPAPTKPAPAKPKPTLPQ
ncbi:MAG TPA: Ig-like domain-containing protein [Gemmatimonadales bacterium]|nr:Ig-like domain-containing protein [Gemmatimonadales bacterium]